MKKGFKIILAVTVLTLSTPLFFGCSSNYSKNLKLTSSAKDADTLNKNTDKDTSSKSGDADKLPAQDSTVEKNEPKEVVNLVPYTGRVEHIFFHPLIVYPEQAFDGDRMSNGFDDWFVTVTEFKRVIQSLYDKNFILVDINSIYEEVEENGQKLVKRKELMIPEGKKPIIISVDDLNYNRYMLGNGTNYKLIIGPDGNVAAYSINPEGQEVISYDNEIVPILDKFVEKHPDFSLNGAKGILAITGYEGILGYRTDRNSPTKDEEIPQALEVVKRLKETGWTFASHSYGHPDITKITYAKLVDDSTKWRNEVESLVGPTQVMIYPHGVGPKPTEDKFKYLQSLGFKIFCHVGSESYEKILTNTNAVLTDRRHVDGVTLRNQRKSFLDLYDADEIIDPTVRPKR
jgi:hypothetical protein